MAVVVAAEESHSETKPRIKTSNKICNRKKKKDDEHIKWQAQSETFMNVKWQKWKLATSVNMP